MHGTRVTEKTVTVMHEFPRETVYVCSCRQVQEVFEQRLALSLSLSPWAQRTAELIMSDPVPTKRKTNEANPRSETTSSRVPSPRKLGTLPNENMSERHSDFRCNSTDNTSTEGGSNPTDSLFSISTPSHFNVFRFPPTFESQIWRQRRQPLPTLTTSTLPSSTCLHNRPESQSLSSKGAGYRTL